jgi:FAD/FMN-containing dehydrogenase
MTDAAITNATTEWKAVLGSDGVFEDRITLGRYVRDTGEDSAYLQVVVKPKSANDVANILAIATKHGTPIHVISTGHNWG